MPQPLQQTWPKPSQSKPIVLFGAGSIVSDAHLPAYRKAGFEILGIHDPDLEKAQAVATQFDCAVFPSMAEALATSDVIYDLATPPTAHASILSKLPIGAHALIQKPMGIDLANATQILNICRQRKLHAAVNFQLRFSPMMLALKDAINKGYLGDVIDFDGWLAIDTPWHLWEFLKDLPRVEISLHSIHYLDLIRSILGDPLGIHAKTLGHPSSTVAQSRTSAILDYGNTIRCNLSINHNHSFGRQFQACEFRICGTQGAAYVKLGVNLDYPRGEPDELWISTKGQAWEQIPLQGEWFPDAFVARMTQLQCFATGEEQTLVSNVEDAWLTMALVEAAYSSSANPATPITPLPQQDS